MTTPSPHRHRRRLLPAITAALTAVPLSVALTAVHPVTATAEPGVPQAPVVVFAEDFENGQGTTPALLTAYTGLPPVNQTYDADPAWLTACNGWLASLQQATTTPPGSSCGSGDWQGGPDHGRSPGAVGGR
ncbi:hypothetical protein Q5530_13285 [Saccharothrix sp. BKS2]|uniref:hypothetical protein n=1 Tax=Saccharothrix sp. BKS2 TaxID=3064400 RepID=UPI0039EBD741